MNPGKTSCDNGSAVVKRIIYSGKSQREPWMRLLIRHVDGKCFQSS